MKHYGYIYLTTNLINHKTYVGQHKKATYDKNYYGSGVILAKAIQKYGKNNFNNIVLCWCRDQDTLDKKEQYYIDKYRKAGKAEYNVADGGHGLSGVHLFGKANGFYGHHHTAETRKKLSFLAHQRTGEKNAFYGHHFNEATKKKISRLGWKHSEQDKIKISKALSQPTVCPYCGKQLESKKAYIKHYQAVHLEKNQKIAKKNLVKRNKQEFKCPYCGKIIHSKGNLTQHIRARHQ